MFITKGLINFLKVAAHSCFLSSPHCLPRKKKQMLEQVNMTKTVNYDPDEPITFMKESF